MKEQKDLIKIIYTSNRTENTTHVGFKPKVARDNIVDFIECLISGTHYGMLTLLDNFPVMRPATKEERDAHCYIFQDETDDKVYKQRKAIYDTLVATFQNILTECFPDVEYIQQCKTYAENIAVDEGVEAAEEYRARVAEVADIVRNGGESVGTVQ